MTKILITGANGQIGTELCRKLGSKYGKEAIFPSDIQLSSVATIFLDVQNQEQIIKVIRENNIDTIYHMAAILSATGEEKPGLAWNVNMNGFWNILESARLCSIKKIFFPSSIAVFGPNVPKMNCPQDVLLYPTTLYGITKASGERLCDYYNEKHNIDIRSIRYPGLISYEALPGGGTTDYAVAIFYDAIQKQTYQCFVRETTMLPMMYMEDAIRATIELMEAPKSSLHTKGAYNIAAMSFTVKELVAAIVKHIPNFTCTYVPDKRQQYADSWPSSIDDQNARKEWSWNHKFNLELMVAEMITKIKQKI